MFRREEGIAKFTPAADYTEKEGYGVTLAGDTATISASATVPWDGIIVEGGTVDQGVSVAMLGASEGSLDVKLGGAVTRGDKLVQNNDGTAITDPGNGARVQVGIANEDGVEDDLIEAFPRTPRALA